jgi:hypothetical protein
MRVLREFESNADQEPYLLTCPQRHVVGRDAESPRMYYGLEFSDQSGYKVKIGIVLSDHGIHPSWILSPDHHTIAIGHDLLSASSTFPTAAWFRFGKLEGVFYEFLGEANSSDFIALHELGVDRFDFSGARLWSVRTPDIAESRAPRGENSAGDPPGGRRRTCG